MWSNLWKRVRTSSDPADKLRDQLLDYIQFCTRFEQQMLKENLGFIELPIGKIGATIQQLYAYLHYLRCSRPSNKRPMSAGELKKRAAALRAAVSEYAHMVILPHCLRAQNEYTVWEKKHFVSWHKEDSLCHRKPMQEKVWLEGNTIEGYCIRICLRLLDKEYVSDLELLTALVCRIQSGTNMRHGNLTRHFQWSDIQKGHPDSYILYILILNMSISISIYELDLYEFILCCIVFAEEL